MRNFLLLKKLDGSLSLVPASTVDIHLPFECIAVLTVAESELPLSVEDCSALANTFCCIIDNLLGNKK